MAFGKKALHSLNKGSAECHAFAPKAVGSVAVQPNLYLMTG
jgi:hypothetical protein